jgi:hypothetical protein
VLIVVIAWVSVYILLFAAKSTEQVYNISKSITLARIFKLEQRDAVVFMLLKRLIFIFIALELVCAA